MRPIYKTLAELRQSLAINLGFGAQIGMIELQIPMLTNILQQAQDQLWRDVRWRHLLRSHEETLGAGQRVMDLPDDFAVGLLSGVFKLCHDVWVPIPEGFPRCRDTQTGEPIYFELSARYDADNIQTEFWPVPDTEIQIRMDYYAKPARFSHNTDRASVDDALVLTLATVIGKGHYKQADVQLYSDRFSNQLRQLKAANFGSDGEKRAINIDPYSRTVQPSQIRG